MINLNVFIEVNGIQTIVGMIQGESYLDAYFKYNSGYMSGEGNRPISISLPFQKEAFSPEKTRIFFESLLPEGFSRRAIADWIKSDENDYISILSALGKECLGAIKISDNAETVVGGYEKLALSQVKELAAEGATRSTQILIETHLSLTGASGKVGLYYDPDGNVWYLPKGEAPSSHIVKQSHVRLNRIVLNEQLCMLTAGYCGIDVPRSFIIDLGDGGDDQVLFATQRYDRLMGQGIVIDGLKSPLRLHQEDFAQALGIAACDKYEKEKAGYLHKMFALIQDYSSDPIQDKIKLLERIVFNVFIGNTDCHIKNFSLIYGRNLKQIRLAPAYDIVATMVYRTTSKMSFYIGDEIDIYNINKKSFLDASSDMGMGMGVVGKIYDRIANNFDAALHKAADELYHMGYADVHGIKERIKKYSVLYRAQ